MLWRSSRPSLAPALPADEPERARAEPASETTPTLEKALENPGREPLEPVLGRFTLTVQTLDQNGVALSGVELSLEGTDDPILLGRSDALGLWECQVPSSLQGIVRATHSGYSRASAPIATSRGARIELVLVREPVLTGRVVRSDGRSAGAGIWVLATDRGVPSPSHLDVLLALESVQRGSALDSVSPRFMIGSTDEGGHFRFDELPWATCVLRAGGAGMVQAGVPKVWEKGRPDPELIVLPAYAAVLELLELDGSPLSVSNALAHGPLARWGSEQVGVSSIAAGTLEMCLAGVDPALLDGGSSMVTLLFGWEGGEPTVGPNEYWARFPGYEEVHAKFHAQRLDLGMAFHTLSMKRLAEAWATLEVSFVEVHEAFAGFDIQAVTDGALLLKDAAGTTHEFPVRSRNGNPVEITMVPSGRHELRYRHKYGNFEFPDAGVPPLPLELREGHNQVAIDLSRMGALVVTLGRPSVEPIPERLTIYLARKLEVREDGSTEWVHSKRMNARAHPFTFLGLSAGEWIFRVAPERPGAGTPKDPLVVRIAPGEIARIELP